MPQTIQLRLGDCIEVLKTLPDGSIGAIVTDPPYLISFMGRAWDDTEEGGCSQEWHLRWLKEAFRVLRPGGTAKVFSATRTFHRLAAAMEEAGFVLDPEYSICAWAYGSGFPKSLNVSKALDQTAGAEREVVGTRPIAYADSPSGYTSRSANATARAGGIWNPVTGEVAHGRPVTAPATEAAQQFDGYGTALKPAWEPFIVGMKVVPKDI